MMFIASKVLSFLLEPLTWILAPLLLGLLLIGRRPRTGKTLCWIALFAAFLSGWEAIPNHLLHTLEARYPRVKIDEDLGRYKGVIVVGGAFAHSDIWTAHDQVALNENAERMTTAVTLALRHPQLQLLYTGGIATNPPAGLTEAVRARKFFDQMGLPAPRVWYEDRSRNTHENAVFSAQVPGVDKRQPWLLLTSAYHMPRTMGVFQKEGWNVRPFPVDYRTAQDAHWYDYSVFDGPQNWRLALHEIVGYHVYRWLGRI